MGRKKKLPEDYAKEHENDFEVRVIWKELSGFGETPLKVPENALVCKFCDTFVKPKGSRISEHLISARHNEMKKRALGKNAPSTMTLPATLQLKLEQENMYMLGLVRTLALAGVCTPAAISVLRSFVRLHSSVGGDVDTVINVSSLLDNYLPVVFNNYIHRELLPTIRGRKLNIYVDNMIDINNIPGIAFYVQYYDAVLDSHQMLLLDISPLPLCNNAVVFSYVTCLIQKYELNWVDIATMSVASLEDINSLAHEIKRLHPHVVVFLSLSAQISEICLTSLSSNLPDLFSFVCLLSTVLSSTPHLTRLYFQTWAESGLQVSKAILPPTVKQGDIVSWVNTAEVILSVWDHLQKFCEDHKTLPQFILIRNYLNNLTQLHADMRRVISYLNPICLMIKALKHGFVADKINELLTQTLVDLVSVAPHDVLSGKFCKNPDVPVEKKAVSSYIGMSNPFSVAPPSAPAIRPHIFATPTSISPPRSTQTSLFTPVLPVKPTPCTSLPSLLSAPTMLNPCTSLLTTSPSLLSVPTMLNISKTSLFNANPIPENQTNNIPSVDESGVKNIQTSCVRQQPEAKPVIKIPKPTLTLSPGFSLVNSITPPRQLDSTTASQTNTCLSNKKTLNYSLNTPSHFNNHPFPSHIFPDINSSNPDLSPGNVFATSPSDSITDTSLVTDTSFTISHSSPRTFPDIKISPPISLKHSSEYASSPTASSLSNNNPDIDFANFSSFSKSFKEKVSVLLTNCIQTNILGTDGFFHRFSIFNPTRPQTNVAQTDLKDFEHYESVLKLFCVKEWNLGMREAMKQELEAYFTFISTTQLNVDSLTYWKLLKSALPNLGNTILSALGMITGSRKPLIKSVIRQAIEDPEVQLSFDNIVRLSVMNYNQH